MKADHELLMLSIEDPKVFASIVERYQPAFLRKALTILPNAEDAADVVQETFVKMYLNAKQFELRQNEKQSAAFSSWAYKILTNTCYSHYKKHKREGGNVSVDELGDLPQEDFVEELSKTHRFMLVLSKIPRECAKLLELMVVKGKSHSDLALEEGVTEGAMRVRLHRAKNAFRKALIENPQL